MFRYLKYAFLNYSDSKGLVRLSTVVHVSTLFFDIVVLVTLLLTS